MLNANNNNNNNNHDKIIIMIIFIGGAQLPMAVLSGSLITKVING